MLSISSLFAPLAISQLALLGLLLAINYRGLLARLLAFFCLCLVAYVLLTMDIFDSNTAGSFVLGRLATFSPFLIWLIAYLLFVDEGRIKPVIWISIACFFLARAIGQLLAIFAPEITSNGVFYMLTQVLPQLAMLAFSAHAILLGLQGYGDDLVVQRRQFRVLFVICMGAVVVAVVGIGTITGLQEFYGFNLIAGLDYISPDVYNFYLFAVSLFFNLRAFRLSEEALTLIPQHAEQYSPTQSGNNNAKAVDPAIIERLEFLMVEEKLYAQPGLTIADLAERLSMQEYKLRRLINQSMQYRNFNQFLNNYRIEAASSQLLQSEDPVSSIALGVGYSSLSVFNKAFKDRFNMTPTEYRNSHPGEAGFSNDPKVSSLAQRMAQSRAKPH